MSFDHLLNFYLNIEDVRLDTPIFSVVQSHDEEKVIPMPSMFYVFSSISRI